MSTNPDTWLRGLASYWTPTSTQFDGARSHKSTIETKLDSALGVFRLFEIGSLQHGTGVWLHSDADVLVSLKGSRPASQWTTLNNVKAALHDRFPSTLITVRQPAVVCNFGDGKVEVVPGFISDSGYWIPDPTGGWMKSHPEDHNKYVNTVNNKHGGGAKMLARQLKVWKYKRNVPISSCYLEMRAAKHMEGESSYSPVIDLWSALRKLQIAQLAAMNDPTGLGSRFTAYSSDTSRVDALSKLDTAVGRAEKAKDYAVKGDAENAVTQLSLLFDHPA